MYLDAVVTEEKVYCFLGEPQQELEEWLTEGRAGLNEQGLLCLEHEATQHLYELGGGCGDLVENADDCGYLLLVLSRLGHALVRHDGHLQQLLEVLQQLFTQLLGETGWKQLCQVREPLCSIQTQIAVVP